MVRIAVNEMAKPEELRLAEKIPLGARVGPGDIGRVLKRLAGDIEVQWKVSISKERWLTVALWGSDRDVFAELLRKRVGFRPENHREVKSWKIFRGFVQSKSVGFGIFVDIGMADKDALLPLHALRAQLVDGGQIPLRTIADAFALHPHVPVQVQVSKAGEGRYDVQLSDEWRERLLEWKSERIDRVLALGVSAGRLASAIKRLGLTRYIRRQEQLGLLTQVVACRKGTDGPGIISRLGEALEAVPLHLFPRKSIMKR